VPTNAAPDGKFRKISVGVMKGNLSINAKTELGRALGEEVCAKRGHDIPFDFGRPFGKLEYRRPPCGEDFTACLPVQSDTHLTGGGTLARYMGTY
jgi:hypothetical protein